MYYYIIRSVLEYSTVSTVYTGQFSTIHVWRHTTWAYHIYAALYGVVVVTRGKMIRFWMGECWVGMRVRVAMSIVDKKKVVLSL